MLFAGTIDAHVHVWTDDRKRYPRVPDERDYPPASFTPEDLFRHARPAGVQRVVLIQMSFYRYDNSYMVDSIRRYPGGIFAGVGIVNSAAAGVADTMKKLSGQGVRGFRITPGGDPQNWLDTPGMRTMWETGAKLRLAMCPLIGADALPSVARMCTRFPDTPVVIDHLARIGADGTIRDSDVAALCGMAAHRNVHVKVSAFYALGQKRAPYKDLVPLIRRVFESFGPERLMWASDSPFQVLDGHRYQDSIALVREGLPFLTDQDREWLLGKTAGEVFFRR
jgi:predicted TIM-barrel fold metal-dependent hydrolase